VADHRGDVLESGFSHSPTEQYIDNNTDGPLAPIPQNLPVGLDDFGWMFAIGGLGIALTLGICSRIAGWGGLILNIMIWFLMWIHASNYWGIGRWWRAHTPAFLH
jgi:thiosulfate dehydrogenase [quinone] large subunit